MTDAFTRWNAQVRLALAARSVDKATADTVLDEVAQHCADSGETPEEAFGTPDEYAVTVVSERIPPEERAGRNWDGLTRADHIFAALTQTGVAALMAGACLWVGDGSMLPLTPAGLVGTSLTAVALPSACLAVTVSRSRSHAAAGWGLTALVALLLAAVAFTALPMTTLGRLPTPALCVLGAVLLWSAARCGPAPHHEGVSMKPQTDARNKVRTEDWLRDLPQLLEERHGVPRPRAAELTDEAANHLIATGRAPQEEFGPVELYALKLAEQEAAPRARWWQRGDIQTAILGVILAGDLLSSLAFGGPAWQTALAAGALAVGLALLTADLVRKRSASASRQ